MTAKTTKFLDLGNGTRIKPYLIVRFKTIQGGVQVLDANGDTFATLPCHESQSTVLIDVLEGIVSGTKEFIQPDFKAYEAEKVEKVKSK